MVKDAPLLTTAALYGQIQAMGHLIHEHGQDPKGKPKVKDNHPINVAIYRECSIN